MEAVPKEKDQKQVDKKENAVMLYLVVKEKTDKDKEEVLEEDLITLKKIKK
jgi:hypothetical protein